MAVRDEMEPASGGRGDRPAWQRLLQGAATLSWIVLTVLSLLPGEDRPHTGAPGNVEHATAYLLSAGVTGLAFPRVGAVVALAAFSAAAGLFELCQTVIPGRSPGVDNWASSTAGALAGLAAVRALAGRIRRRGRTAPGG